MALCAMGGSRYICQPLRRALVLSWPLEFPQAQPVK